MDKRGNITQHEFGFEYFRLLADVLPGETTLNQIRVAQYIGLRSAMGSPPCNKEIAAALHLPTTTVSRALVMFLEAKILRDIEDPDDGRRRFLIMNKDFPGSGTLDRQVRALIARYFQYKVSQSGNMQGNLIP